MSLSNLYNIRPMPFFKFPFRGSTFLCKILYCNDLQILLTKGGLFLRVGVSDFTIKI